MRIIDRYIVTSFLKTLLLCIGLFFSLFIIVDLFDRLDDFVFKKIPLHTIVTFYLTGLPVIFVNVTGPAMLVSSLLVLTTMNKNNEIAAFKSSGVSAYRLMLPFFLCGLLLWGLVYWVGETLVPKSNAAYQYITKFEFQSPERKKTKKIVNFGFSDTQRHLFFFEEINPYSDDVQHVTVLTEKPDGTLAEKITAVSGTWNRRVLDLHEVTVTRYTDGTPMPQAQPAVILVLDNSRSYYLRFGPPSEYMSRAQLWQYIQSIAQIKKHLLPELLADYHAKASLPFSVFLLLVLGVCSAFQSRHRGGPLLSVALSAVLFAAFYLAMSLSLASGKGGLLSPVTAAWLPNALLAVISAVLFFRIRT